MFASDDIAHLIQQFCFARGPRSHYPVSRESYFVLPSIKLEPD